MGDGMSPYQMFQVGQEAKRSSMETNPWLNMSGPETPWTEPYKKAGVDPWKFTRKDGYRLFNPWLELDYVPLADKADYIDDYRGPDNPQIDYWREYLEPMNQHEEYKWRKDYPLSVENAGRLISEKERERINLILKRGGYQDEQRRR